MNSGGNSDEGVFEVRVMINMRLLKFREGYALIGISDREYEIIVTCSLLSK